MLTPPEIVKTKAQPAAVIRLTVPRAKIVEVMGPAMGEVMAAIGAQGIAPAGPIFSHHFRMDPAVFDFEVGVSVSKPVTSVGRVQMSELPAATVARTVYEGSFEGLGAAWGEFGKWIADQGHKPAENLWECYLSGPDPASNRTELNRPLVV